MKRLAIVSAILFCLTTRANASESFILSIPLGEDFSRQTGEVRVTLGLDSAPAGAQLILDGTTTVNLGQTVTFNGDSVTFAAGTGNSVNITYRPLSNFPPNDFCHSDSNTATPKSVPMRFSGTQDVISFRSSSYAIGAPGVECSQVFKRVGDFPALIFPSADGVAPELVAIEKGRNPLDVVLVLDKSGSMNEVAPGGAAAGPSKADILKSALSAFVAQWQELDAPAVDENGNPTGVDNTEDRIGIVFFDSTPAGQMTAGGDPPANIFVQRGTGSAWDNLGNTIQTLSPGGSTSIGGGLNEGMKLWKDDPDHDLIAIVVTDGKQNTSPLITADPMGILSLTPISGFNAELRKRFVPIQSIGFGLPTGVDLDLLDAMSTQTNGRSFIAIDAGTIFNTFGQTLVSILKGNTISTALQRNDTMTGAGPSAPQTLVVDRSVPRFVVSVQWAPPDRGVLDLEIMRPGGTIAAPTEVKRLPQAVIARFDLKPEDAGNWSVRVKRGQSPPSQSIPYTLTAFLVENDLEYRVSSGDATIGTGDPIHLRVSVAYDGKPLEKLPAGAIRVGVQRPAEALGTILHGAAGGGDGGTTTTPSGDLQNAYDRKVASLTSRELVQRLFPRDVETLTLIEEKPGVYGAKFDATSIPGAYAFNAVLDWDDPRTGHVRREERVETQVRLRPVVVPVTTRRDGDNVLVSVTPRDRFGNFLGPGYAPVVTATLTGPGTITTVPVDRDQTGTYVFTVTDVPAGQTPDVAITVDGTSVGSTNTAPPASFSIWRAFIDAGPNYPSGSFGNFVSGDLSINAGVERRFSPTWSLELALGYHTFDSIVSTSVRQASIGVKRWFGASSLHPFLGASVGAYRFEPGEFTRAGIAASGGLLYELSPRWGIEGVYTHHIVDTENDQSTFGTLQAGVRFSF